MAPDMRWLALLALVLTTACGTGDRITLTFEDAATRSEAVEIAVAAVQPTTRDQRTIGCDAVLAQQPGIDDPVVIVAQRTSAVLAEDHRQSLLLVQLRQQHYLFLAEAHDRYGFSVARGCAEDEITSRRSLDLAIALSTVPTLSGRLSAVGATSWVQHAGEPGVDLAPAVAVRALDPTGQPLAGVAVRALVGAGNGTLQQSTLTTDATGLATTRLVAGVGDNQVAAHVRGLAESPVVFNVSGLVSPVYQPLDPYELMAAPVVVLGGDFDLFDRAGDLVAVQARSDGGCVSMLHGRLDGSYTWDQAECADLGVRTESGTYLPAVPTLAVGGQFDHSCGSDSNCRERPDLAVAGRLLVDPVPVPYLAIHHHKENRSADFQDAFVGAEIPLRLDTVEVTQLVAANLDNDAWTDLVLKTRTASDSDLHLQAYRNNGGAINSPAWSRANPDLYVAGIGDPTIAAGDVDSDGDDDLLMLSRTLGLFILPNGDDVAGHGSGGFFWNAPPDQLPHLDTLFNSKFVLVGDVDEDGLNDLAVIADQEVLGPGTTLTVAFGTGSLTGLQNTTPVDLPTPHLDQAVLADFNADGHLDLLLLSNQPPQQALVLGGDGRGRFAAPLVLPVGLSAVAMAQTDLNGDGVPDLSVLGRTFDRSYLVVKLSTSLVQ